MSATINIIDNFSVEIDGITYSGKQGEAADSATDEYGISITGDAHVVPFTLATATAHTIFDDDDDFPIDFSFMFIWCDQDIYIQVIGSATCFTVKQLAKVPFKLTYDSILAAANTTPITGGSEPAVTDVDSVVLGNYSGTSARGLAAFFN